MTEQATPPQTEKDAIRQALADDAWEGHDEPLTSDDLDRIAEVAARAVARLTDDCTCGWGGVHDADNPRCALNCPPDLNGARNG